MFYKSEGNTKMENKSKLLDIISDLNDVQKKLLIDYLLTLDNQYNSELL